MATDGSRSQTPGGGGGGQGPGSGQGPGGSSARLRAEEVVERGLRLYAHGDLIGALAEWRRALEIDHGNRRGRDYVTYVEDHFELLREKFRAARERRATADGTEIEIEAGDPMEDIDPYESIELEGEPGLAEAEGRAEGLEAASAAAGPEAPHARAGSPGGKHSAGRRPWSRRRADSNERWPADERWPPGQRKDTLEMTVAPACLADDDGEGDTAAIGPARMEDDDERDDRSDADADDGAEDVDAELFASEPLDGDFDAGIEAGADDGDDGEPGTGEITLPARRPRAAGMRAAQGSGLVAPQAFRRRRKTAKHGEFDLSDFPADSDLVDEAARRAEEEAWADGTPVAEPQDALAELRDLREEELREVRVTFRRPGRTADELPRRTEIDPPVASDLHDEEEEDEKTAPRPRARRTAAGGARKAPTAPLPLFEEEDEDEADEEVVLLERRRDRGGHESDGPRAAGPRAPADESERETAELPRRRLAPSSISIDLASSELAGELDRDMASCVGLAAEERTRERVLWLIDRARREKQAGHFPLAVVAVDLALAENPESAVVQKLLHSNRDLLFEIYASYLGDMTAVPALAVPMSAIPMDELDHRAAFLLSRVDGVLSLEDVLDVSGMARLEAFRHLSRLMLRGILEIRP